MDRIITLIPARLAAQRLPNKPLALIQGKPLVVHAYERAQEAALGEVYVACCSALLQQVVGSYGGKAILTDPDLPSGTDRIFQALEQVDPAGDRDIVLNLQGDLPFISPGDLAKSVQLLIDHPSIDIATLVTPLPPERVLCPHHVKVAMGEFTSSKEGTYDYGRALYFSRAPIPYADPQTQGTYYHHIGVYAYRRRALERFVSLPPCLLEKTEKLEQLRALEAGLTIYAVRVSTMPDSVDTYADLEDLRKQREVNVP